MSSQESPSVSIITRAATKVAGNVKGAEWIMILLPILLDAMQKFLAECQLTPQQLANQCTKVGVLNSGRLYRNFLAAIWDVRRTYGMTLLDVFAAARASANAICDEAEVTAGSPEGQAELEAAFTELKTAA